MTRQTHITLSEAAQRASITFRGARKLVERGTFKAKPADDYPDGRVRILVSIRSVNAYIKRREQRRSR
jgi:hypothetical protein